MEFHKWLKTRGYLPIGIIIENYRSSGMANEDIDKMVEDIKNKYRQWCSENNVKPFF